MVEENLWTGRGNDHLLDRNSPLRGGGDSNLASNEDFVLDPIGREIARNN